MTPTTKLPTDLQKALTDLHHAEETAGKMAAKKTSATTLPAKELVNVVASKMQKPGWKMITKNRLSGGLKQRVFTMETEVEFGLDTKTLLEKVDESRSLKKSEAQVYKQAISNIDPVINDIVLDSLMPKAFGLSSKAVVLENRLLVDDLQMRKFKKTQWPLTMTVVDDLVHFDYVGMLNFLLRDLRQVDKKVFRDEVWIIVDFFRRGNGFSRSYYWDDNDVIVSIEAEFERIE